MNASGSVPGFAMIQCDMYQKHYEGGFATNTMSALYDMQSNMMTNELVMWSDDGICMAIYLGMAMEMPLQVGMVAVLRKI